MKLKLTIPKERIERERAEKRRAEYPPFGDFADAMFWRDKGDDGPWKAYLARVEVVKAKYPKVAK